MEGPHRHAGKSKYPGNNEKSHMWILMSVCVGETLLLNRQSLIDCLDTSERLCLGKKISNTMLQSQSQNVQLPVHLMNLYKMV